MLTALLLNVLMMSLSSGAVAQHEDHAMPSAPSADAVVVDAAVVDAGVADDAAGSVSDVSAGRTGPQTPPVAAPAIEIQAGVDVGVTPGLAVNPIVSRAPLAREEHEGHGVSGGHADHNMFFDDIGMVMNSNTALLPQDCASISEDVEFVVHAGVDYALTQAGRVFGYDQHEFNVAPCSRVKVTLVNEDQVRHQWMLHGLPRYLYPQGMFHLEASGGQTVSGSFIVPSDDATYLVHCDITQHMEKGMKAQLVVGRGSGDLWSIPGITADFNDSAEVPGSTFWMVGLAALVAMAGAAAIYGRERHSQVQQTTPAGQQVRKEISAEPPGSGSASSERASSARQSKTGDERTDHERTDRDTNLDEISAGERPTDERPGAA